MSASITAISGPSPGRALLFGGSGQIGERVLSRLLAQGWQVVAWSRQPQCSRPGLQWRLGEFASASASEPYQAIFSCGPLDHFAHWYQRSAVTAARVVAFGSTSLQVKQDSSDRHERDVAKRLDQAERQVFALAASRNSAATVLRPTLVYGAGRDRTLSQIAAIADKAGFFVLPNTAAGLRQPVHVEDLADAALAVLPQAATHQRSYALGGGESLPYHEMIRRVLQAGSRPARLCQLPSVLFNGVLGMAHAVGRLRGLNHAAVLRMGEDLVFDLEPARRDFAYAPRNFHPRAEELGLSPSA